jgi:dienelactone hydrolase
MTTTRFPLALALAAGALVSLAQGACAQTAGGVEVATPSPAGTGPHPAIYEERSTLPRHVVYRPAELAALGESRLGIYVFGNGGCSADGTSARNHLLEIASHGYLAIAPGIIPGSGRTPPTPGPRPSGRLSADTPVEALREAIDWAIAENGRQGSPLYGRIATDQVAVSGWSCGGLQALLTATDPRVKTSVIMYSGIFNDGGNPIEGIEVDKTLLGRIHGSVLYVLGSPTDMAYPNGMDDYRRISGRAAAVVNIPVGHGGTFAEPNGGLGAQVVTAWLNWQLRGEGEGARRFRGNDCGYCTDPRLTMERKNIE